MLLSDLVIILSRPAESGNVGAVCRCMKNMGLSRLRVVAPEIPLDDALIRARAVHAGDVWEGAGHYKVLGDALADCPLVIGTTRRRGQKRKEVSLTAKEAAAYLAGRSGTAALVFGNERTGLGKDELALCTLASHIPADDAFPSLNLSHAVQIYAYELYCALAGVEPLDRWIPADRERLDSLVGVVGASLESIGFYKQYGREDQERFFRDIFSRSSLTEKEAGYLDRIFRKIASLAGKRE